MWVLLGLLKALLTDLSGGFHPRRFKNPAEDIPIWQLGQDIRDYKDLLKMSQVEISEEQQQALLDGDEEAREAATTLHSFPPSKDELAKLKPGQGEEELIQKGYEEVVEGPDGNEGSKTDVSDDPELPEMPSTSLEPSLDWEGDSEPAEGGNMDAFDVDLEE